MAKKSGGKKKKSVEVDATHLVLSCIDHRCTDDLASVVHHLIDEPQQWNRYDHIALPGASLGIVQHMFPAWGEAFWQQFGAALTLHPKITTVLLVDHLHCGAYKLFYTAVDDREYDGSSRDAHDRITGRLKRKLEKRYPSLKVERWVLEPRDEDALDWRVTNLDDPDESYDCHEHDE
ncbi:MAG: hypothetical protein JNK82_35710 [Myxococcaceae bacterium]|nr:hypothetical protein [Myxococcaceae bacterium]